MMTRADGVTIVTTREQLAQRRVSAQLLRRQELEPSEDSPPHGIFIWSLVMFALIAGFVLGYFVGHARG